MGERLIRQKNGLFAVFSDTVDDLILFDGDADGIVEHYVAQAAERAREAARLWVEGKAPGRRIYTVEQALEWFASGALNDPNALPEWKKKDQQRIDAARAILENPDGNGSTRETEEEEEV